MNRKSYHNIVIEPTKIVTGKILYFAVYKDFDQLQDYVDNTVTYTVKATLKSKHIK